MPTTVKTVESMEVAGFAGRRPAEMLRLLKAAGLLPHRVGAELKESLAGQFEGIPIP